MSTIKQRTDANNFLSFTECIRELDNLKFAASSLASGYSKGSHEGENAQNAVQGIRHRIDYLVDSLRVHVGEIKP